MRRHAQLGHLLVASRQRCERIIEIERGHYGRHGIPGDEPAIDRKSTRLNSSHLVISYAVFCLKKNTTMRVVIISLTAFRARRRATIAPATPSPRLTARRD